MAVIIRKMDLPPNCKECDLSNCLEDLTGDPRLYCDLLGQVDDFSDKRDSDCPLEAISEARLSFLDSVPDIFSDLLYTPDNGLALQPKNCGEDEALIRLRQLQHKLNCKDCQEFNCDFCAHKDRKGETNDN